MSSPLFSSPLYIRDWDYYQLHGAFAGIDEAGRGALAGPVVIAAVVLDYRKPIEGINDSKLLKPKQREELYDLIVSNAVAYHITKISHAYIDRFNILQATLMGFSTSFRKLDMKVETCLIDGNIVPPFLKGIGTAVIKGDQLHAAIAAASILAKVYRDRLMVAFDDLYPEFGFANHKGYGTAHHSKMIHCFGSCPIHRKSFHIPNR
ncbi:MAG: ribonuclease HII [Candidatus Cloacimonetes bacterium]|nr:ribonuclease HII [Candidatus Cloacimonadota bacterium]